jgi:hypothetical protein
MILTGKKSVLFHCLFVHYKSEMEPATNGLREFLLSLITSMLLWVSIGVIVLVLEIRAWLPRDFMPLDTS